MENLNLFSYHWEQITQNFEFEKVHKAMKALDWHWLNSEGVPQIAEIVEAARRLCLECYEAAPQEQSQTKTLSTGGFRASYSAKEDLMTLEFILDTWVTGYGDYAL